MVIEFHLIVSSETNYSYFTTEHFPGKTQAAYKTLLNTQNLQTIT